MLPQKLAARFPADNILPNWGDELSAAASVSGANPLNSMTWPKAAASTAARAVRGDDVGGEFRTAQKAFKDSQARYDRDHPTLSTVSTVGGTVAGMALPGGAAAKGAKLGAKALQAAKVGAAYGAMSGAGEGETLAHRAGNAARSAGIGAAGGAVLGTAAHHAPAALRAAGRIPGVSRLPRVPRAVMGLPPLPKPDRAEEAANRRIMETMQRGHIDHGMGAPAPSASPEAVVTEMQRRTAMGVPAFAADVSEPMRGLARWTAAGEGPGQTRVREALTRRQSGARLRTRQHVIDTMGNVGDPLAHLEGIVQQSKDAVAPLYREAYAQPMVVTPEIEGIMATPAFREALPHAVRNIRNAQRDPVELGFRLHADGSIEGAQSLTAEGFDQVARAMRDNGRAAMDKSGFRPMDTTDSVHINNRVRDLKAALGEQNQPYAEANARYADDMAQRDAFKDGQGLPGLQGMRSTHRLVTCRKTLRRLGPWARGPHWPIRHLRRAQSTPRPISPPGCSRPWVMASSKTPSAR